ncbi:type I CRISPR-associated protein Cas7 [Methylorubrum extorquens]
MSLAEGSAHPAKGAGTSIADLGLVFEALTNMFYRDRSAACGGMAARKLVIFSHASALANALTHALLIRRSLHPRDKGPGGVLARFHRNTPHAAEPPAQQRRTHGTPSAPRPQPRTHCRRASGPSTPPWRTRHDSNV